MELNITLFREKFIIRDMEREGETPLVATSNRIVLSLPLADGTPEILVVRSQTMYSCIRMASQIVLSSLRVGSLINREIPYDYSSVWGSINSNHEILYNMSRWVAVYYRGREIYASGEHHVFLDVIERFDFLNVGRYDHAVVMAEENFGKLGRKVSISYDSNIGMVMNAHPDVARCGLVHRGLDRNATFNFVAEPKEETSVSPFLCLNVAAAFLEGLQLANKVGMANSKLQIMELEKFSAEEKEASSALYRLSELTAEIINFERLLKVRYRPEKPEFSEIVMNAEQFYSREHESRLKASE